MKAKDCLFYLVDTSGRGPLPLTMRMFNEILLDTNRLPIVDIVVYTKEMKELQRVGFWDGAAEFFLSFVLGHYYLRGSVGLYCTAEAS